MSGFIVDSSGIKVPRRLLDSHIPVMSVMIERLINHFGTSWGFIFGHDFPALVPNLGILLAGSGLVETV